MSIYVCLTYNKYLEAIKFMLYEEIQGLSSAIKIIFVFLASHCCGYFTYYKNANAFMPLNPHITLTSLVKRILRSEGIVFLV